MNQYPQSSAGADASHGGPIGIARAVVIGILGLAYAFIVWSAVFYLIEMAQAGITGSAWAVLLAPAILPIIAFVVALLLTRRRSMAALVVVMLAGLGLSAVFWLDTLSYAIRNGAALLG